MKLAILGYGAEGKSVERYFKAHPYEGVAPEDIEIKVFDKFTVEDLKADKLGLEDFDVVFRSPSVPPAYDYAEFESDDVHAENEGRYKTPEARPYWTSATKYFFEHCPCEIIAVTGTKGKGTTCSMITALLEEISEMYAGGGKRGEQGPRVFLVGNIGIPALDVLDEIRPQDNVVFEMSSFQLWDLHMGSNVGVLLRIEPDHLNVHRDFDDYVFAKSAVSRYKTESDFLVYFKDNVTTAGLAEKSVARKLAYPIATSGKDAPRLSAAAKERLGELLDCLKVPGEHNRENAEAALLAVAARCCGGSLDSLLMSELYPALMRGLAGFEGLPHRCQFLRELNHVRYYDDNYSSALPALDVALKAFEASPTILIAGGFSKGTDAEVKARIFSAPNLVKAILIGSTAKVLAEGEGAERYELADSLGDAVRRARVAAEAVASAEKPAVVLMSPGFASFDMFKNFTDRGEQYTKLIMGLE